MKKFNLLSLVPAIFALTVFFAPVRAQETSAASNQMRQPNFKLTRRPNLLAELDLSPDQIRQIRRINRDKQPLIREAKQRVETANRKLDAAIYADTADETEIQSRLKEEQTARAELSKIKALTEYEVRKILNSEQLVKFREVRERFKTRLETFPKQQNNRPPGAPVQNLFKRQRKLRQNN